MDIWIGRNGERHGPYKEADVRQWLRSGEAGGDDLGWHEGLADWQPLAALFPEALAATPASFDPAAAVPPPTTTVALEDYAGFWKRFGAWVIDYLILLIPITIIAMNTGAVEAFQKLLTEVQNGSSTSAAALEYARVIRPAELTMLVVGFLYYALFEGSGLQATPGKLAFGIRVTTLDGQSLGYTRSVLRNLVRLANIVTWIIPLVCYLTVAWTQRNQGFHDMMAKALVLNGRASEFRDHPARDDHAFHA